MSEEQEGSSPESLDGRDEYWLGINGRGGHALRGAGLPAGLGLGNLAQSRKGRKGWVDASLGAGCMCRPSVVFLAILALWRETDFTSRKAAKGAKGG